MSWNPLNLVCSDLVKDAVFPGLDYYAKHSVLNAGLSLAFLYQGGYQILLLVAF